MPYIEKGSRQRLETTATPITTGELNYLFTQMINRYLREREISYTRLNDVLGALEGCKQEFYRRVVVPYEEQKRFENGDVYDNEGR